jgi:hypothetical protein
MARQVIGLGSPTPGVAQPGADTRYAAFDKTNANFVELYGHVSIIRAPYRPENYGATFDGTTNDTAAWTSMLSDISTAGGGEVIVPSGTSRVTTIAIPAKCTIRGAGRDSSYVRRLSGTAPLFTMEGSNTSTRCTRSSVEGIGFHGHDLDGPLFRTVYASLLTIRDVSFNACLGPAMLFVECWDSRFDNIYVQNCGNGASTSPNNTAPSGTEAIQFWGAIAASGFGYSTDSNNLLTFTHLHVETFKSPAVAFARGLGTQAASTYGVRFIASKFESATLASQYVVLLHPFCQSIHFNGCYFSVIGQTNASFASTTRLVHHIGGSGVVFRDCWILNGVTMDYGFRQWTGSRVHYDQIMWSGNLPTAAAIWVEGGSAPYINEINRDGQIGGITTRFPAA